MVVSMHCIASNATVQQKRIEKLHVSEVAAELLSQNFRKRALLPQIECYLKVASWGIRQKTRETTSVPFISANVLCSQSRLQKNFFILHHFSSLKSSTQIPQVVVLLLHVHAVLHGNDSKEAVYFPSLIQLMLILIHLSLNCG